MTEARDPDMSERFSYDRSGCVREVYFNGNKSVSGARWNATADYYNNRRFSRAVDENKDFTNDDSACDEYSTDVMESANAKPNDWPDPESHKVGQNDDNIPNYIDETADKTATTAGPGGNTVMMEGGKYIDEHMVVINENTDGSITGKEFAVNEETEQREILDIEADSQEEFESQYGYDTYHYYNWE